MIREKISRLLSNQLISKFASNGMSNMYSQILTLVIQLALIPLFLSFWGKELYTEWIILIGIPAMLTLLDFGVVQASASAATMQAAQDDWDSARITIHTSQMFTTILSLVLVIISMVVAGLIPFNEIFELKLINQQSSQIVFTLMVMYLAVNLQGGVVEAMFRTLGKAALGNVLLTNRRLLDLMVTAICLVVGGRVISLASTLFISQAVYLIFLTRYIVKQDIHQMCGYRLSSKESFKKLLKPSISYMGFPIAQLLTMQGGVQMLNMLGASYLIVPYTMTRTLVRTMIQIAVVVNYSLKPELSRLIGVGKSDEAKRFTSKIAMISFIGASVWFVFLILCGPRIISLWCHDAIVVTRYDIFMVGLHALANVYWFISAAFNVAGNTHSKLSFIYGSSSILGLLIWFVMRNVMDPFVGVCFVLLIPECAVSIYNYFKKSSKLEIQQ
jgi:O-antigen/teichoic acid export membrane protein